MPLMLNKYSNYHNWHRLLRCVYMRMFTTDTGVYPAGNWHKACCVSYNIHTCIN